MKNEIQQQMKTWKNELGRKNELGQKNEIRRKNEKMKKWKT